MGNVEIREQMMEQFQASIDLLSQLLEVPLHENKDIVPQLGRMYADGNRTQAIVACNALIEELLKEQGL